jgi:tRNA A37 threonylcarbamoyladenosine synthetase subunit TsaC/SUA5/YrdC
MPSDFYDEVSLVQTDTTAGLLSKSSQKLSERKKRKEGHNFLEVTPFFRELQKEVRVPKKFRNLVRRSKKRTFVYPNGKAIRVVSGEHKEFFEKSHLLFSTSANISGEKFDLKTAYNLADNICFELDEFSEKTSSQIIQLSKEKKKFLRK